MRIFVSILLSLFWFAAVGQFAPPAGQEGSAAVASDSSLISGWAGIPEIVRGPMDISNPDAGEATYGSPEEASGQADNVVVSLGDGGVATYALETALSDHSGPDFAVFENSFSDEFLELAFVEVSSDGEHFVRFPAVSGTQTENQTGTFETMDATKVHNLAGKYRAGFGTPFDLEDLADSANANISAITHIRIVDVVGSIDSAYATYDSQGNKVNDPFPTAFESGGFDLDALAFLAGATLGQEELVAGAAGIYPNPVKDKVTIAVDRPFNYVLRNSSGQIMESGKLKGGSQSLDWSYFPKGVYLLQLNNKEINILKKVIIH